MVYSQAPLSEGQRVHVQEPWWRTNDQPGGRDIAHAWGQIRAHRLGLGLLIGVTLTMAGVYRGMVDDAQALLHNSGADVWVVQRTRKGPMPRPPRSGRRGAQCAGMPGVARGQRHHFTMQVVAASGRESRAMVVGIEPGGRVRPATWWRAAHHPHPLRGRGRRENRFCPGRAHPHPPQQLHRGGLARRMVSSGAIPWCL